MLVYKTRLQILVTLPISATDYSKLGIDILQRFVGQSLAFTYKTHRILLSSKIEDSSTNFSNIYCKFADLGPIMDVAK